MAHINDISRRQRGVLTRAQALSCGISEDKLRHLLSSGRWQRLLAGIYATFSGPVSRAAWRWAAVLRAGDGAVLSHTAAAEEVGLAAESTGPIHVTIPINRRARGSPGGIPLRRSAPAIVVHRSRQAGRRRHPSRLPPQTRVEETVLDLAATADSDEAAMGWIAAACGRRLTTARRITRALDRRPTLTRRRDLARLLGEAEAGCMSLLEWRYLRGVDRPHGLPTAIRQQRRPRTGGNWYDDVWYPDQGVRVELDGSAAHPPEHRRRDFRRDNAAAQQGEVVLRYRAGDVRESPCEVAAQVIQVLQLRGWTGQGQPCGPDCRAVEADRSRSSS